MKVQRRVTRTRNAQPMHHRLRMYLTVARFVLLVSALPIAFGLARTRVGSEAAILGGYFVGTATVILVSVKNLRWHEEIWMVGFLLVVYSMATMVLSAQYWLAVGAFVLFLTIIVTPIVRLRVREELRNRQ